MPSGNQGGSQDPGRQNGGAGRGARESRQNVGQRFQEGAEQVGQRLNEGYETARDELGRRYRRAEGMMARNPTPSVLIGFGIGFGLGLVVTAILANRERETWADRHLPDRFRNLPSSLNDTLEQLAESVRNLPGAIRGHLPSTLTRR
jgi:ElaB/YqjD/DUF883 family membrane-anchored ribosome-binding protein